MSMMREVGVASDWLLIFIYMEGDRLASSIQECFVPAGERRQSSAPSSFLFSVCKHVLVPCHASCCFPC